MPFDTYHRDDQPESVKKIIGSRLPAVAADTDQGIVLLLDPEALERCSGSVEQLADALTAAADHLELGWS